MALNSFSKLFGIINIMCTTDSLGYEFVAHMIQYHHDKFQHVKRLIVISA